MRLRRRWTVLGLALAAGCLEQGTAAATANAGIYLLNTTGSQVCALGGFISNVPGFAARCGAGTASISGPSDGSARGDRQLWQISSPNAALTIIAANLSQVEAHHMNTGSRGYGGGSYWKGGGDPLNTGNVFALKTFMNFSSQYFGLQLVCGDALGCDGKGGQSGAQIASDGSVTLTVEENQAPDMVTPGSGNLLHQSGDWVWNAPGQPWPATLSASDPSGVCDLNVSVDGAMAGQVDPHEVSAWQQCPNGWSYDRSVDTTRRVPTSGTLMLGTSATNAAGVQVTASATVRVDNVAPTVTLKPVGSNSTAESATLRVSPKAGPSGIASVTCTDTFNGQTTTLATSPDPSASGDDDVTVDGAGSHTVSCTVANGAVDPTGAHHTSTASTMVLV